MAKGKVLEILSKRNEVAVYEDDSRIPVVKMVVMFELKVECDDENVDVVELMVDSKDVDIVEKTLVGREFDVDLDNE